MRGILFFIIGGLAVTSIRSTIVIAGTLNCSVVASSTCTTGVVLLRMSSSTNAHAELATGTTPGYANNVVCCTGVVGMGTSCSGATAIILRLASTTNSHVQESGQAGYTNNACISAPAGGTVTLAYQATNCIGYDTTLASMASTSNSHIGNASAYTTKICGTMIGTQSIVFSLSTSTISLGGLASNASSYASSTGLGSSSEVEAHSISVSTNASSGYAVTVQGQTLTSQENSTHTIQAIGGTNTIPSPGTEQFGIRIATTTGTGLITSPYALSGFAYAATATTTSQVASGVGDGITTIFSVRYLGNIAQTTESGTYSARLVYVATANF